ncbi:hypothetical protein HHI36_019502 [Cryptolaemus montrouzieri]|uniref:Reverse transcriptase domain-containing protein n=1 Tax=Cryptolaemus montrouzieri TaxID=559131 RepID=A0ABD2P3U9_9CUCU
MKEIQRGVPQGSMLGSILFLIYTMDLPSAITHPCLEYCMYADDLQVYVHAIHGFMINPIKSSAMIISSKHSQVDTSQIDNISINNIRVPWVESVKKLGIILDCKLNFEQHVNSIYKKSYYKLKMLYQHKHELNQDTKLNLAKVLVYPHFGYCNSVY